MAVDRGCANSEDVEHASTISAIMLSQPRRSLVSIDLIDATCRTRSPSAIHVEEQVRRPHRRVRHLGPRARPRKNARGLSRPTIMPTSSLGRLYGVSRYEGLVRAGGNRDPTPRPDACKIQPGASKGDINSISLVRRCALRSGLSWQRGRHRRCPLRGQPGRRAIARTDGPHHFSPNGRISCSKTHALRGC
jgi:hypothetical protein